ncbi:hypothetical protein D3C87_565190 [compost metagenome]
MIQGYAQGAHGPRISTKNPVVSTIWRRGSRHRAPPGRRHAAVSVLRARMHACAFGQPCATRGPAAQDFPSASGRPARPSIAPRSSGDSYREQLIPFPQNGPGRRPDGRRQSCRHPRGGRAQDGRDDARGGCAQGGVRRVSRAGADDVFSALLDGRRRGGGTLLRKDHAQCRRAAAVRHRARAGHRLLSRVCRSDAGGPPVQHRHPGGPQREDRRQVPQDPPAGPFGPQARRPLPASGEEVLRSGRPGLWRMGDQRRQDRHVPVQ